MKNRTLSLLLKIFSPSAVTSSNSFMKHSILMFLQPRMSTLNLKNEKVIEEKSLKILRKEVEDLNKELEILKLSDPN